MQNKKYTWEEIQSYKGVPFLGQNDQVSRNKFFFLNIISMYLLAPFIVQNLKTNLRADPELSGCAIFGHKMAHLL